MSSEARVPAAEERGGTAAFPGRVRAHPTAFVAPGAVVVGDVQLGERTSVWFGAVLRGDLAPIAVGDESNVQDNAVFHVDEGYPAAVGRGVVVGHGAIVHGATVEDGCLIGMGAIVLTGAHIGEGSLIAAGALVGERKRIPPRSLVAGVPGKVLGPVSDEMRAGIAAGAARYVALSRRYLAEGIAAALPPAAGAAIVGGALLLPDELEVARLVGALAAAPAALAGLVAGLDPQPPPAAGPGGRPGPERIVAEWLRDDAELWGPRLERLLTEDHPALDAPPAGSAAADAPLAAAVQRLAAARARSVARLRLLPLAGWARAGWTPESGPLTVGEHVRRWTAEDAARLRRLAAARAERGG
jgi:carbonic anhydrase/acetyltransferase-like protein (isoleucine patch superfamily)